MVAASQGGQCRHVPCEVLDGPGAAGSRPLRDPLREFPHRVVLAPRRGEQAPGPVELLGQQLIAVGLAQCQPLCRETAALLPPTCHEVVQAQHHQRDESRGDRAALAPVLDDGPESGTTPRRPVHEECRHRDPFDPARVCFPVQVVDHRIEQAEGGRGRASRVGVDIAEQFLEGGIRSVSWDMAA